MQPMLFLLVGALGASVFFARKLSSRVRVLQPLLPPRRSRGFNCCEQCSAPLRRHPEASWRYDGTCARCGRVQTWETNRT